jgi:predicted nuclease of predicted toxin-antitoxin system
MKFLPDVCVSSHTLQSFLIGQSHDVMSAMAIDPKASDDRLLLFALEDERVLLTEDRDFGELAFVRKLRHGPIVRLVNLTVDGQVAGIRELLERHSAALTGPAIITVTRGRIRIRP